MSHGEIERRRQFAIQTITPEAVIGADIGGSAVWISQYPLYWEEDEQALILSGPAEELDSLVEP